MKGIDDDSTFGTDDCWVGKVLYECYGECFVHDCPYQKKNRCIIYTGSCKKCECISGCNL